MSSCNSKKQDDSQVRRFTFSVPSSIELPDLDAIEDLYKSYLYSFDDNRFLIIDAPSDHDYNNLKETLQKNSKQWHQSLSTLKPLERIYKLDQQSEYTATQGQLIKKIEDAKKYVLTLEIVNSPELKKEYKAVHAMGMAWPEITSNMKKVGVKDMEIYWQGYQAYLIMDTRVDFDFVKDGETWSKLPRESEWQEYVAKFQKVDPDSKAIEKWQTMVLE